MDGECICFDLIEEVARTPVSSVDEMLSALARHLQVISFLLNDQAPHPTGRRRARSWFTIAAPGIIHATLAISAQKLRHVVNHS